MAVYSVLTDEETHIDKLVNESGKSSVIINRIGGEVIGYRIYDEKREKELPLLVRDGITEKPAEGWKNHAPILFPIVGGIKGDKSYLGETLITSRGNHGFTRHSKFELVEKDTSDKALLHYRLNADEETGKYYPFDFQMDVTYQLKGNDLTVFFEIANKEKERDIYYCFGWHPGFRTPVIEGVGSKLDCQILLNKGVYRKYQNNEHCRLTGETSELEIDGAVSWTEEELELTIMLEIDDRDKRVCTLYDPASGIKIEVEFKDFPHLGLWSEKGNDFICIEPWQGMDDHEEQEPFDKKVGIVKLSPGGVDKRTITVKPKL